MDWHEIGRILFSIHQVHPYLVISPLRLKCISQLLWEMHQNSL